MVVLTRDPDELAERGLDVDTLAAGHARLAEAHGMPIDVRPKPRLAASEPACRAVVAARLHAPERAPALLRRLRIATMAGGLLDDPALIDGAAEEAGLDPGTLRVWSVEPATDHALRMDMAWLAIRSPPRSPSPTSWPAPATTASSATPARPTSSGGPTTAAP